MTGPRRGHTFVTSTFALQLAEIEAGRRPPVIDVGDVTSKRDWTDVRDTVRAYWLALERGQPGEQAAKGEREELVPHGIDSAGPGRVFVLPNREDT